MSGLEGAPDDDVTWRVRQFIYATIASRGTPPNVAEVAHSLRLQEGIVEAAFRRLHDLHAIFLEAGTGPAAIRMAHPFSAVPTGFRVHSGDIDYWANCAWDALGIPAALKRDAMIAATYTEDGQPAPLDVRDGKLVGSGRVHVLRPFRRWYDDMVFT